MQDRQKILMTHCCTSQSTKSLLTRPVVSDFFLLFSFAQVTEKHTASNLERVTPCKYLLDFWCEHTIMCVHQKLIKLFTSRLHTLKSMRRCKQVWIGWHDYSECAINASIASSVEDKIFKLKWKNFITHYVMILSKIKKMSKYSRMITLCEYSLSFLVCTHH